MKRSIRDRRAQALERLKSSRFEQSRACRKGTLTREEWETAKQAEITHLEELNHGRKTS